MAGIAQRTVFQGPKTETASISVEEDAPYLLIDGAVLNQLPARRRCARRATATSSPPTAAPPTCRPGSPTRRTTTSRSTARARSSPRTSSPTSSPKATARRRPRPPAAGDGTDAAALPAHSPVGSDLWLDEFQQTDILIAPLQLPDGDERARRHRRRRSRRRPTCRSRGRSPTRPRGPVRSSSGGAILMAIGVFLYILGIRHARRSRGPRRKGLPLPVTEPIDLAVEGEDKGVISAGPPRAARSPAVAGRSPSCPSSPSRRCCSPAARRTRGRSSARPRRPPPPPPSSSPRASRRRRSPRRRPSASSPAVAATTAAGRRGQGRGARRDAPRRRRPGGARDQLHAARRDRRLQGARPDPHQAARDRAAAGVRRLAALGDGRRRRRGDEDLEHHGAHAGGRLVALQALVPGEPRGVDPDARPRARVHRSDAGPAGLVVPRDGAGAARGRLRRHHQQGREERVLRHVRRRGRPPSREHRRGPPAPARRVQQDGRHDGQPDVLRPARAPTIRSRSRRSRAARSSPSTSTRPTPSSRPTPTR